MVDRCERTTQAMLFVDIVEATRLLERDEDRTIDRWRAMVQHIESTVLPPHGGRLVKSTGDGLLLAFSDPQSAVAAAFAVQRASHDRNGALSASDRIDLRMAVELDEVVADEHDLYGRGVMRAARLMTLAGPGEIVVSASVRDRLTPSLDADLEDLGECYLKHLRDPVRAYRVGPPGPHPVVDPALFLGELLPSIAVIPFAGRGVDPAHAVIGDVLADEIIGALSRSPALSVISRLSTAPFRGRDAGLEEIRRHLNVSYVLS